MHQPNKNLDSHKSTCKKRQSTRVKTKPKHFNEFVIDLPPSLEHSIVVPILDSAMVHPIHQYVSYNNFSESHHAFLATITSCDESKKFSQATTNRNWLEAMSKEIKSHEDNVNKILAKLPPVKKVIHSIWAYKVKYKPGGHIERYKARLVAKGYTQIEGIHFHEKFAPINKLVTVRIALVVASKRQWEVHQLDVKNAFLHGDLDKEVYI